MALLLVGFALKTSTVVGGRSLEGGKALLWPEWTGESRASGASGRLERQLVGGKSPYLPEFGTGKLTSAEDASLRLSPTLLLSLLPSEPD